MNEEEQSQQVSIFSFGENTLKGMKETTTTVREYEFTEPLRRCSICKNLKPLSEFTRRKTGKRAGNYERRCKECQKYRTVQYKKDNPEKYKESYTKSNKTKENKTRVKEWGFLYFKNQNSCRGYFLGTGFCLLCGEICPLVLENHHTHPQINHVISLCSNCHKKYHTGEQELHMITILNAIEKTPYLWKDITISSNIKDIEHEDISSPGKIYTFDGEEMEVLAR